MTVAIRKPRIFKHPTSGRWVLKREHIQLGFSLDHNTGFQAMTFSTAPEAWAYAFDGITPEGWPVR